MLISTIILVIWIVILLAQGQMLFEWWWLPISYVLEIGILFLIIFGIACIIER